MHSIVVILALLTKASFMQWMTMQVFTVQENILLGRVCCHYMCTFLILGVQQRNVILDSSTEESSTATGQFSGIR
jgi:hypothetical protein